MLIFEPYRDQLTNWPKTGRHILAQFDDETIYVYQAFCPSIAEFAVNNQYFGGGFGFRRMTWIKTNFLWMMYRSGWATKLNQERILAIRLKRNFFEDLARLAVPSLPDLKRYGTIGNWEAEVKASDVRLQWDPDRHPSGNRLERRAIQIGIRGSILKTYAREALASIDDITSLVSEQRLRLGNGCKGLLTPRERIFRPVDPGVALSIGIDKLPDSLPESNIVF